MIEVSFLDEKVELQYPATRAAIEPVIAAQVELSDTSKEDKAQRISAMLQIAAACVAACDPQGRPVEYWFQKLYENNHRTGESALSSELGSTAMAMCGLEKAATAMGKEDPQ